MIGRLVHTADFQRALATPPHSRSAHFAVHHVIGEPAAPQRKTSGPVSEELSTEHDPIGPEAVDNPSVQHWLGSVVPKRHARRAVTRSLLKRQIRSVMSEHVATLAPGLWLVRLRAPFAVKQFPSASSQALVEVARSELCLLFTRAAA